MRSSILMLSAITLLGGGVALGWLWRGHSEAGVRAKHRFLLETSNDAGHHPARSAANVISAAGQEVRAGSPSAHSAIGKKPESPAEAAHRLLQNMMAEGFHHGPPVELFDFLQALAGCDSSTLHQLLREMRKATKETGKAGRGRDPVSMMILARLAGIDPESAMDGYIELRQEGGRVEREVMGFMMAAAAKTDLSRAEAMIERMPDEESKKAAQAAFLIARARQDPDGALQELIASPPHDEAGFSRAWEVVRAAAGKSPEKALETITKFGTPEQQTRATAEVMRLWLAEKPKSAASWALESMDPAALNACLRADPSLVDADKLRRDFNSFSAASADVRTELAASLAGNLAQKDVNSALTWSSTLTGADQTAAHASIGKAWIDRDPVSASEWLATWPQSSYKDSVASHLVEKISADDPESALTWACSIQGEQRASSIGRALSAIKVKDPAAAEQAMNALSEADRSAVNRATSLKGYR